MDKKAQTTYTYNISALSLAKKFDELGVRIKDIEEVFALTNKSHPRVLEIGCGNGRDAEEIVKHTDDYLGIDISEKLIELARQRVPNAHFQIADVETFTFPHGLDIIFAFASLIHTPKEALKRILSEARLALNQKGLVCLSMKFAETYTETTREDAFGVRTYYLYSQKDAESLSEGFIILKNELIVMKGQTWLEVILQNTTIKNPLV